jgi:hypothetical protein
MYRMGGNKEAMLTFIPKAWWSLQRVKRRYGINSNDAINQAVQVYDYITEGVVERKAKLVFANPDGTYEDIKGLPSVQPGNKVS